MPAFTTEDMHTLGQHAEAINNPLSMEDLGRYMAQAQQPFSVRATSPEFNTQGRASRLWDTAYASHNHPLDIGHINRNRVFFEINHNRYELIRDSLHNTHTLRMPGGAIVDLDNLLYQNSQDAHLIDTLRTQLREANEYISDLENQ